MKLILEWLGMSLAAGAIVFALLAGIFGVCLLLGAPCSFDSDPLEYLRAYLLLSGICAFISISYPLIAHAKL